MALLAQRRSGRQTRKTAQLSALARYHLQIAPSLDTIATLFVSDCSCKTKSIIQRILPHHPTAWRFVGVSCTDPWVEIRCYRLQDQPISAGDTGAAGNASTPPPASGSGTEDEELGGPFPPSHLIIITGNQV